MSECKAYAGWPPMLLNKRSDRLSKTNFERKKNDGPLDALGGHHTRKLAGLLGNIGSLYGAAVLDQPRELPPRTRVLGLARNFAGGRGRRLPGANFRETPLSESVQSMARRKRR